MIARSAYLWAQYRHARPKASKSSAIRTRAHLDAVGPALTSVVPAGSDVLSIGPRNIDEVQALDAKGWTVSAVDLFPTHPRIHRGDMERLPYPDDRFGLAWVSHVFEHAYSQRRAAREIVRVTRPDGMLWIAVPRGGTPNPHDRWRFDTVADVVRPFREAAGHPVVVWSQERPSELRVLLRIWKSIYNKRRVLVALTDLRMARDWAAPDVLADLSVIRGGTIVLAPESEVDRVQNAAPGATVEPWEPHRSPSWVRWIRRRPLRTLSYAVRARLADGGDAYRHKLALRRPLRHRLGAAICHAIAALLPARLIEGAARMVSAALPVPRATRELLDDFAPDVVALPTTIHEGNELALCHAARRRGIPVVMEAASLDALVSKGVLLARPDILCVWGEEARRAAIQWHGMAPDQVRVTGPARFDALVPIAAKPESIVYIAGTSVQYWADEEDVIQRLDAWALQLGYEIVYRPHPRRPAVDLTGLVHTTLDTDWQPGGWRWDRVGIADTLGCSICLVTAWSTMVVEAALLGRPTLLVAFGHGVPRFGEWPHMRTILQWSGVRVCRSPEELIANLRALLVGAWSPDPEVLRNEAMMVARSDGKAKWRLIGAIEEGAR